MPESLAEPGTRRGIGYFLATPPLFRPFFAKMLPRGSIFLEGGVAFLKGGSKGGCSKYLQGGYQNLQNIEKNVRVLPSF